ncbi:MAG: DUF86 domain-containing protein [Candidatus Aenigmarchaeota archaeon]|nr:DUF86 domain-containing protein [Candidatus Aenigmarchaeota archaeon]
MLDKERILAKIDEMEGYSGELKGIIPDNYESYERSIEKKRACERLLHISVECVIDICNMVVVGMKMGLPDSEVDIFEKLEKNKIISRKVSDKLKKMRAFRNVLVHRYGHTDDRTIFDLLKNKLSDFREFSDEILKYLKKSK